MKIIVLSDLHIPSAAGDLPVGVYSALKKADMLILAGDLVDVGVYDKLKKLCPLIKAVSGNMDSEALKKKLPDKEIISVERFKIGLMHGYGPPDKILDIAEKTFKNDGVQVVIFGHSHQPLNRKINGVLYFNPGSPTDKVFAPYNSFGMIEIDGEIKAEIIKL
jgi:putative phosphoesterase